jgi:hypothetical protein
MSGKRNLNKIPPGYKSAFTKEESKLLREHDTESLYDEIWINRVMLLRTVNKMNAMSAQLTFRDHLDALRAVTYATGRIASLLQIREELFKPYQEVENQYREYFDEEKGLIEQIDPLVFGEEKWDEMQWEDFRKRMNAEAVEKDHIVSENGRDKH